MQGCFVLFSSSSVCMVRVYLVMCIAVVKDIAVFENCVEKQRHWKKNKGGMAKTSCGL